MNRYMAAAAFVCVGCICIPASGVAQTSPIQGRSDTKPGSLLSMPRLPFLDSVVKVARKQIGIPYTYGGETRNRGFDCSGLVRYVMQAANLRLPRNSAEQARIGESVPRDVSKLRVGDLLTFGNRGLVSHIGIYVGSGRFIHASSGSGKVVESLLDRPGGRGIKPWLGVRRLALQESASSKSMLMQSRSSQAISASRLASSPMANQAMTNESLTNQPMSRGHVIHR